jgi:hypothetical protein
MLEQAIKTVQRTLREYISVEEREQTYVYTKILSHLVNSWAEVRLMKLIYEAGAFSGIEKTEIITRRKLEGKWTTALNTAFCNAFDVKNQNNISNQTNVPYTARIRHAALLQIITGSLVESSAIRNRIAHGQWKHALTNDLVKINRSLTNGLRRENILVLQFRLEMFKSLAQIIHDLAVSKPTFQRDFDANYKKIEEQQRNAENIDYDEYSKRMIQKKRKGIMRKKRHFSRLRRLGESAHHLNAILDYLKYKYGISRDEVMEKAMTFKSQ